MRDTDWPYKWTASINVKTKFDFLNTFLNLNFELGIKIEIINQKSI